MDKEAKPPRRGFDAGAVTKDLNDKVWDVDSAGRSAEALGVKLRLAEADPLAQAQREIRRLKRAARKSANP